MQLFKALPLLQLRTAGGVVVAQFIGRAEECAQLEVLCAERELSLAVVYGRRRVGKTSLVRHFVRDRQAVFFTASENAAALNVENLCHAMALSGLFPSCCPEGAPEEAMQATLASIFAKACVAPLVLVVDEYPWLAHSLPCFAAQLAALFAEYAGRARLMVILCGSAPGFMEEQVTSDKSPLHALQPAAIRLAPFDFFTLRRHYTLFRTRDAMRLYGVIGGTLQYLSWLKGAENLQEVLLRHVLNPGSRFFEEPGHLLRQGVRERAVYNAILSAIASGADRLRDIAARAGLESGACSLYLNRLITLNLVRREYPAGEEASRRTLYAVEHPLFRFLYRYVPQNLSSITMGNPGPVLELIARDDAAYMHQVFATICRQWLEARRRFDPALQGAGLVGRWWGSIGRRRLELDIAARDDEGAFVAGHAFWTEDAVQPETIRALLSACSGLPVRHLYVFAMAGFGKDCLQEYADACVPHGEGTTSVHLVAARDMLASFP